MISAEELGTCIYRFQTDLGGPSVVLVGGVHGNERTGIETVLRLKCELETGVLKLRRGMLTLALGNPLAIERGTRGSVEGADLNRCFRRDILARDGGSYEECRARELMSRLSVCDIGLDLHATNKPSVPFLFTQPVPNQICLELLRHFACQTVLCDPDSVFAGEAVTLDEHFGKTGLGICYETGLASDVSNLERVMQEVKDLLSSLGLISQEAVSFCLRVQRLQVVYALTQSLLLSAAGFEYAPGLGEYNLQPYGAGQVLGHHGSVPCLAQTQGVIVFPKPKFLWVQGQPVGYLARQL